MQLFSYPSVKTCVVGAHRDGSFEYPQHMFWLKNKNNNFQLHLSGGLDLKITPHCNSNFHISLLFGLFYVYPLLKIV